MYDRGMALGEEFRGKGVHVALVPLRIEAFLNDSKARAHDEHGKSCRRWQKLGRLRR